MAMNEDLFLLDSEELAWALSKNTPTRKLMAAAMLKFFQLEGKYPSKKSLPSSELMDSLAQQLGIPKIEIKSSLWDWHNIERLCYDIRKMIGYTSATEKSVEPLIFLLIEKSKTELFSLEHYRAVAYQFFKDERIEPLSPAKIDRHIRSAMHRFEKQLFKSIQSQLTKTTIDALDEILVDNDIDGDEMIAQEDGESDAIRLRHLKQNLRGVKLKHIEFELNKLQCLRNITLPVDVLSELHSNILEKYYSRIFASLPGNIREFVPESRYPMIVLFCYVRRQKITDYLTDFLVKLIDKIKSSAEKQINKQILLEVKKVDGKFDILGVLADATAGSPKGVIENEIYPKVSQATLKALANELKHRGKWYQNEVHTKMRSLYSHGQRTELLTLLQALEFKHTNTDESRSLVDALQFIVEHRDIDDYFYPESLKVPLKALPSDWKSRVCEKMKGVEKINRMNYEIGILEELSKQLGYKGVWVEDGHRYRHPQKDLPQDWEARREYYYKLLGMPLGADEYIRRLEQRVDQGLQDLNENLPQNNKVKVLETLGGRIKLSPSEPQAPPINLNMLHREINQRWSNITMLDILKEVDLQLEFTDQFQTIASRKSVDRERNRKRILLCLYGIGSNIGLKRVCGANQEISYSELRYTKRRFINKANVKAATVQVINQIFEIRDPKWWGEGTTGCACDSTKISVWDENLMSEYHVRYREYGAMIYLHVDKNATIIHSRLKTCSSSEVGAMIQGVLEHDTIMEMDKTYMDTHGQSVLGFAFSAALGFELLPRLKNINTQKLFYSSHKKKAAYPNLTTILKGAIQWKHIRDQYDEFVKHVVALKIGLVSPDVLIKKFSRDNYNHPLFKALMEIGKTEKTIFLCKYLASEALRIEIHEALNVVEMINSTMSFIFYGKLGEISTNNRDDQELGIACLHLLQVCMVYINTLIIQSVLSDPKWDQLLTEEDKRALTPSLYGHINPYGLFPLDFNQRIHFGITPQHKEKKEVFDE